MTDLMALTAEMVNIASVSREEQALVSWIESALCTTAGLELTRVGDNLVARTDLGRSSRLILAGHTDTVPANANASAHIEGDRLWGVGSADMKGGLAVMVEAARTIPDPAVDVTYVFYAREEVAAVESGLGELFERRPDLLRGDVALLGEPTGGALEAGCQGSMRLVITLKGERAHTARPWMGRNAIHRLGGLLVDLSVYRGREPQILGCQFREALQAVIVNGGVAPNVVPDQVEVVLNHRFAPDRSTAEAEAHVRDVIAPWIDGDDEVVVVDVANAAQPSVDHPLVAALVSRNGLEVRAKLGWTDVARFAAHGVPAANFGPGDAELAHAAGEYVTSAQLDAVWIATADLLRTGAA